MVLDIGITAYGLFTGTAVEVNPVFSWIGSPVLTVLAICIGKIIAVGLVIWLVTVLNKEGKTYRATLLTKVYCGMMGLAFVGIGIMNVIVNLG